jgi:4-amino-4-deoxy-L-arabinose transferase-like glycosyltransferase
MSDETLAARWTSSKTRILEANRPVLKIASDSRVLAILLALLVMAAYLPFRASEDNVQQYVYLADALLHGRLNIENPPPNVEVSEYEGQYYVYHPPAPVIFLIPAVAVFGTDFNQSFINIGLAAITAALTFFTIQRLGVDKRLSFWVTALLVFGTTFWFTSVSGGSSYLSHIAAVLFLTLAIYCSVGTKRYAVLAGLFFALAMLSRNTTMFAFPFFALTFVQTEQRWRNFLLLAIGAAIPLAISVPYNYLRFDNILDVSYLYSPTYILTDDPAWIDKGRFDLSYIPRHIVAILFLIPSAIDEFPYFAPNLVGLGLFFTTPALLYAFRAPLGPLTVGAALAVALVLVPNVTFWATGWYQFGYRYSLDFTPFLLILVAKAMQRDFGNVERGAIILSILINFWGIWVLRHMGISIADAPSILTESLIAGLGL